MLVNDIREKVEGFFSKLLDSDEEQIISISSGSYGHATGDTIEALLLGHLQECGLDAYYTNQFVEEVFKLVGPNKNRLENYLDGIWWSKLPLYSTQQKKNFLNGKPVGSYQQAGADIVVFYGDDLYREPEKVILINAKSHSLDRKSRAPNIISAQRLLEFCRELLRSDNDLEYAEYWFIGVNHKQINDRQAQVEDIIVKDLFKIDVSKITQINFDAAIQIQTHIEDMVEIEQTKAQFIKSLSSRFIQDWQHHRDKKEEKYVKLYDEINALLRNKRSVTLNDF